MDELRFDSLTRTWSAAGTRRVLLGLLIALPRLAGLPASVAAGEAINAAGRRKRRKKRHKRRKDRHRRNRKPCRSESRAKICAGRCGSVKDPCRRSVDCGPCQCEPACPSCQRCDAVARICLPDMSQQGKVCGPSQFCLDGDCACGDVCASGCTFSSLQEAIDATSGGTLRLCAETYPGPITMRSALRLVGAGSGEDGTVLLGGAGASPVVTMINSGPFVLEHLRITGGKNSSGAGGVSISSAAVVSLANCAITGNEGDIGGGIDNQGELALRDSSLSHNTALRGGGGLANAVIGTVNFIESSAIDNDAGQWGGGILNHGTLTLEHSTLMDNAANERGGGVYNGDRAIIDAGHSTISWNSANDSGGGIWNGDRAFFTATVVTMTQNTTTGRGGGVFNEGSADLTDCSLTVNSATSSEEGPGGGGIYNSDTVTLTDTTIEDNTPNNCAGIPIPGCSG